MFNIEKSKNFLLSEIKVNEPLNKIEIIQHPIRNDEGDISDTSLNKLGIKLRSGSYPGVNLFKNNLYYTPSYQNEGDIPEISNILNSRGIKNNIVTWYGHPYIKILSKYYNLIK